MQSASGTAKQQLQQLLKEHNDRAGFMYQYKAHIKQIAIRSFKSQNIIPIPQQSWLMMQHKGTAWYVEVDYDVDRPEIINNLNPTYFKRKITVKSLNIIQHSGDHLGNRKIYAWSSMRGGKAAEKTAHCLLHAFQKDP